MIARGPHVWAITALGLGMSVLGCECDDPGPGLSRLVADMKLDPESIDFGPVPIGAAIQVPVAVQNTGTDDLKICIVKSPDPEEGMPAGPCPEASSIDPADQPFALVFESVADTGNWIVTRSDTREFLVRFAPGAEGSFAATITLLHNAVNGPATTITVTGVGVAPQVNFSQTEFDFGDVTVNQRRELTLTLTNGTQFPQPVTIPPIAQNAIIFGTSAGGNDTAFDQPFIGEIPGNGSLDVTIWYQPPEEGMHVNMIDVQYCPTCSQMVTLRGNGVKPSFELVPADLDFGDVQLGQQATRSFVVRNVGNALLNVYTIDLEPGTSGEYSFASQVPIPITLNPTDEFTVDVTYTAMTPGRDEGAVLVTTDAFDDPNTPNDERSGRVTLAARAVGPDLIAFPPAVNFGTVAINGVPASRVLQLQNGGNTDLTISEIRLETPTGEITAMIPAVPNVVPPAGSIEVRLGYGPVDAGLDMATVVIVSDDPFESTLGVPVQGIGGVPTTCAVNVAPTQLTFGLVERGTSVALPVEIRNGGAQPCTISNVTLNGGAEFTVANPQGGQITVAPGSSHRVQVQYAPTAYGMHSTLLEFMADDPAAPMFSVPINGQSAPSDIRVIPSQVDFNVVPVTCRSPNRAITVYNTGSNTVRITEVMLDPSTTPEFELQPFAVPQNLTAGGSAVINMRYHPADIGSDTGVLFITIDLGGGNLQRTAVPLSGEGQLNPTVTDTFQQLPTPKADVLFVVDNSGSMSEEQSSLGANLGSFLAFAQQEGIDFQLAVATTDVQNRAQSGRFVGNPRIITTQTPNANNAFRANVNVGTNGSGTERGLEAAYLALTDPLINTENAGFLRQDAALAVIVVSDEEDYSTRAVSFYENFLRNIKGFNNAGMFSFSAIVGTQQPRCTGPGGRADYAARYIQVAQNTGGVVESICNANWGQTLANIGLNSFGLRRQFILSSQPVPSTISVTVDGQIVPSVTPAGQQRWQYAQGSNSIDFQTGSVPQANATISVTYTVACLP